MTLRVWGNSYATGENSTTAVFQPFVFQKNLLLKAVKPSIILIGSPTLTAMSAKIYANDVQTNAPGVLLATSDNTQLKADITSEDNAFKQIWFDFSPEVSIRAGDTYHVVLNWTGAYTFADDSHVAWAKDFPQPINPEGYTPDMITIGVCPYAVEFFTTELY